MSDNNDYLLLKWGTIKGWKFESQTDEFISMVNDYLEDMPLSCAMDNPGEERKELLCKIIEKLDGEIQNDWTGEYLSKQEAKNYVMEYGKKETNQ